MIIPVPGNVFINLFEYWQVFWLSAEPTPSHYQPRHHLKYTLHANARPHAEPYALLAFF